MVKLAPPVYLFIGSDSLSKDTQIKKLKTQFLPEKLRDFNLDVLSADGLELKALQESLLRLPVQSPKRIIVIKDCQDFIEEVRGFLKDYIPKARPETILILDFNRVDGRNDFVRSISRYCVQFSSPDKRALDTFSLSRRIEDNDAAGALEVLHQLLMEGERPERIMGGLRYDWEKNTLASGKIRRRLKLLLTCDVEIKTGRLKADFALEKLVIGLCAFK
ncbi:MAG: hypothetical protein NTU54_03580 [Candidatus Omnitrophica bacterium]|nr:hypothetical protein [Candidatus Omnitrophota bacterium]